MAHPIKIEKDKATLRPFPKRKGGKLPFKKLFVYQIGGD